MIKFTENNMQIIKYSYRHYNRLQHMHLTLFSAHVSWMLIGWNLSNCGIEVKPIIACLIIEETQNLS